MTLVTKAQASRKSSSVRSLAKANKSLSSNSTRSPSAAPPNLSTDSQKANSEPIDVDSAVEESDTGSVEDPKKQLGTFSRFAYLLY